MLDHIRNEDIKSVDTLLENKILKCKIAGKIAKTRSSFWEKEQRSTAKEMEGQHQQLHQGIHEEIPTDRRHGTH